MEFIINWLDLIWLPLILLVLQKKQRLIGAGFFFACALMMRMQVELMSSTGFVTGMLPFMNSHVLYRGIGVFSLFYAGFLVLAVYSKNSIGTILMAACISIFFAASITSMLVMVL